MLYRLNLQLSCLASIEMNAFLKNCFTGLCPGQCSWSKKFLPGPIRMRLSLLCRSEAGVACCCAEWGQLCHLQQLIEGFGTVPAGREDEIFKESKIIKVTQNTLFPVLLMNWFLENGVADCNSLTRGKGGSQKYLHIYLN